MSELLKNLFVSEDRITGSHYQDPDGGSKSIDISCHGATKVSVVEQGVDATVKTVRLYVETTNYDGEPVKFEVTVFTNDLDLKVRRFKSYRSYLNKR